MSFIKAGQTCKCIKELIDDGWLSSCCFLEGNDYSAYDEDSLIDEYGSHIWIHKIRFDDYFIVNKQ